jgi:hypothetical protein
LAVRGWPREQVGLTTPGHPLIAHQAIERACRDLMSLAAQTHRCLSPPVLAVGASKRRLSAQLTNTTDSSLAGQREKPPFYQKNQSV